MFYRAYTVAIFQVGSIRGQASLRTYGVYELDCEPSRLEGLAVFANEIQGHFDYCIENNKAVLVPENETLLIYQFILKEKRVLL